MIEGFEVGHWYRFTGKLGKDVTEDMIQKRWDCYGMHSIMCKVLDGEPRYCELVGINKDGASFVGLHEHPYVFYWKYGLEFWENCDAAMHRDAIKEIFEEEI